MFEFLVLCLVLSAAHIRATPLTGSFALVNDVEYHGSGRFPDVIGVFFSYQGNNNYLVLARDDETTRMLSEDVFEVSHILPSGVFKDEEREDFAAYDSGNSNVIVVHRETDDVKPKFYGRFEHAGEKMTMHAVDGSHELHRVWRENDIDTHHITRRGVTAPENVIELFLFSDLSVYQHFDSEMMPTDQVKDFLKPYLAGVAKEVDAIFNHLYDYGANKTLRVYFQQYQIITDATQQKWVEDNLSGGVLQTAAVTDLQTYYYKLMTKFGFPYPDHLMAITKLQMEGGVQVMSMGTVCGDNSAVGTSIVRIDNFPVTLAQGIALTFSVPYDGDGNTCAAGDQYIMSTTYGAVTSDTRQGNRWKFSPCSVTQFQSALDGGLDLSCLQTEDRYFNWEQFETAPYKGELLTTDEQCVIRYQSGATFCDDSQGDIVDCYSSSQGCNVAGSCQPFTVAHLTPCGRHAESKRFACLYGFCTSLNLTTTTSSTTDSTSTTSTTERTTSTVSIATSTATRGTTGTSTSGTTSIATDMDLQTVTPTPPPCVVKSSVTYYEVPGCSCSGCDGQDNSGQCGQLSDCPGKRVKVTTTYVRKECASNYNPGPRTMIEDADDAKDLIAEVFKEDSGNWQLELVVAP